MADDFSLISDQLKAQFKRQMTKAGLLFVTEARTGLNTAQPYKRYRGGKRFTGFAPSLPGQYPKKLSGQLQKSVTFEVNDEPALYLGSNLAGHPAWLQTGTAAMRPRPWLTLTYDRIGQRIADIILAGGT